MPAEAYNLNIPPVVVSGKGKWGGSRIAVDRDNIIVSCIKLAEEAEGTLVVRMYECYGRTTKVSVALNGISCKTAYESDMLERKQRKVTRTDFGLELDFRPYEIKTILLEG